MPELPEECSFYWQAYKELIGSRGVCDTVPISEVKSYCDLFKITDSEMIVFLIKFVSGLTEEMLQYKEERQQREARLAKMGSR